jgi:putative endonuclease
MDLPRKKATTKQTGDAAEDRALAHLEAAGLRLVARNYRTPGRGGGEIDLVMRDRDGTLVFVKRRRIVFAARHFLQRLPQTPPCRFDVVAVQTGEIEWLRAAFDAA